MIERAPWQAPVDPMEGVVLHELSARTGGEPGGGLGFRLLIHPADVALRISI